MNTVYNTLLTHKIGIVSGDLHHVYIFTHTHTFYTFCTYFWRVRLRIYIRRPGSLEEKL